MATVDWDDVPSPSEKLKKNQLSFLSLVMRDEKCAKEWSTSDSPPVSSFEPHLQFLAKTIRETWQKHEVLLEYNTFKTLLEASEFGYKERSSQEANFNIAKISGAGIKPDDYPMLVDRINGKLDDMYEKIHRLAETVTRAKTPEDLQKFAILTNELLPPPAKPLNIRVGGRKNMIDAPPTLIEGLLRRGDVANFVSAPKMRKTWTTHDLAFSLTNGLRWMGKFQCQKSKVLIIDNELHEWEIPDRWRVLGKTMNADDASDPHYVSLRNDGLIDIYALCERLKTQTKDYDIIILDALYRFFPAKFDENSNADWTRLFNVLDNLARQTGCAIINVHHASKGNQSEKSTTDSGSGGGAQSRAADCHMVMRLPKQVGKRPDEAPKNAIFSAVVRGFPPVDSIHLEWSFPRWIAIEPDEFIDGDEPMISVKDFASKYCPSEVSESRQTIEAKARDDDYSYRDAKSLFDGALAEGFIDIEIKSDGPKRFKLYRLSPKAKECL